MNLREWLVLMERPKRQEGESDDDYTDRIIHEGAERGVFRQCSIGYHEECSDPDGDDCRCAHHMSVAPSYGDLAHWLKVEMDDGDALREMAGVDAKWSARRTASGDAREGG